MTLVHQLFNDCPRWFGLRFLTHSKDRVELKLVSQYHGAIRTERHFPRYAVFFAQFLFHITQWPVHDATDW